MVGATTTPTPDPNVDLGSGWVNPEEVLPSTNGSKQTVAAAALPSGAVPLQAEEKKQALASLRFFFALPFVIAYLPQDAAAKNPKQKVFGGGARAGQGKDPRVGVGVGLNSLNLELELCSHPVICKYGSAQRSFSPLKALRSSVIFWLQ